MRDDLPARISFLLGHLRPRMQDKLEETGLTASEYLRGLIAADLGGNPKLKRGRPKIQPKQAETGG